MHIENNDITPADRILLCLMSNVLTSAGECGLCYWGSEWSPPVC